MLPKLKEVKYPGGYRVWLKFADGVDGVVDLESELWGDVFEPLKDLSRFSEMNFNDELGTITWPNGADFSPEFLYKLLCPEYELKPSDKINAA